MGFEPRTLRFTVLHSTTELNWFVVKRSSFLLFINSAGILRGFQGLKKIAEQCYWEGPGFASNRKLVLLNIAQYTIVHLMSSLELYLKKSGHPSP